jgi:hypothetical protein
MVAAAFTKGKRFFNNNPPSHYTPLSLLSNLKRNNLGLDNYALCDAPSLGTMVSMVVEHDGMVVMEP